MSGDCTNNLQGSGNASQKSNVDKLIVKNEMSNDHCINQDSISSFDSEHKKNDKETTTSSLSLDYRNLNVDGIKIRPLAKKYLLKQEDSGEKMYNLEIESISRTDAYEDKNVESNSTDLTVKFHNVTQMSSPIHHHSQLLTREDESNSEQGACSVVQPLKFQKKEVTKRGKRGTSKKIANKVKKPKTVGDKPTKAKKEKLYKKKETKVISKVKKSPRKKKRKVPTELQLETKPSRLTFRELRRLSMLETQEQLRIHRIGLSQIQRDKLDALSQLTECQVEEAVTFINVPPFCSVPKTISTKRKIDEPDCCKSNQKLKSLTSNSEMEVSLNHRSDRGNAYFQTIQPELEYQFSSTIEMDDRYNSGVVVSPFTTYPDIVTTGGVQHSMQTTVVQMTKVTYMNTANPTTLQRRRSSQVVSPTNIPSAVLSDTSAKYNTSAFV